MNAKEIVKAYGMPTWLASKIAKDPSQFRYWGKCGEVAYDGCFKWVDKRQCCSKCSLCQRCCQAHDLCNEKIPEKADRLAALLAADKDRS